MTDHFHSANAIKYIKSRQDARQTVEATFLKKHPEAAPLILLQSEYIAGVVLGLSGRNFSMMNNGLYIGDLIVSFTRTHFIAVELIGQGDLIDAAVLLRKQIELLARLHELVKADGIEHLLRRTPNIKDLGEQIRRLYSVYSEVAHSSNPIHLQLLGRITVEDREYTPLYPVFDENALVTLRHQVLIVVEFHVWLHPYLRSVATDLDLDKANDLIEKLASCYIESAKCGEWREELLLSYFSDSR